MTKFVMNENPHKLRGTVEGSFWLKVVLRDDDCWDWLPSYRDRSGRARFRQMDAARWAYLHFVGEVPRGTELAHSCLKKDCVNYAHLVPKTHAENVAMGPFRGPDKGERKPGRWL